jgi:UDP-N-acetylglucosamine 2-epimerase
MPSDLLAFLKKQADTRKILITAHRRENWGVPIRNIAKAVAHIVALYPDVSAIWPIHPNPAVRANVQSELEQVAPAVLERICLTQPVGYSALIHLLDLCIFTLTDSGGIQEEASAFAKPVLIARNSTERQELVDAGGAVLVGTDVECIMRHVKALLTDTAIYRSMQVSQSPFGDGQSASRIADVLVREETKRTY